MPRPIMKITNTAKFRKSQKKPALPLLPGDAGLIRQIEDQREAAKNSKMINEPLEYTGPLKDFTPVEKLDKKKLNIIAVMHGIQKQMWSEYPMKDNGKPAISTKTINETEDFRKGCPQAVTVNQLYGVYPSFATQVDRSISQLCREGRLRLIQVSSTDSARDLLLEAENFYDICDPISPQLGLLCRSKPDATWFSATELLKDEVDISAAVSHGLLVVDPGRKGVHVLALPNQGRVLKLLRQGRTWLLHTMVQYNRKFKELPESQIVDKLHASKRYWTQLHGVNLDWILYDAVGGGWIDGFQTPIGRGWKVLRDK